MNFLHTRHKTLPSNTPATDALIPAGIIHTKQGRSPHRYETTRGPRGPRGASRVPWRSWRRWTELAKSWLAYRVSDGDTKSTRTERGLDVDLCDLCHIGGLANEQVPATCLCARQRSDCPRSAVACSIKFCEELQIAAERTGCDLSGMKTAAENILFLWVCRMLEIRPMLRKICRIADQFCCT